MLGSGNKHTTKNARENRSEQDTLDHVKDLLGRCALVAGKRKSMAPVVGGIMQGIGTGKTGPIQQNPAQYHCHGGSGNTLAYSQRYCFGCCRHFQKTPSEFLYVPNG